MPGIFDNTETSLLPALGEALGISDRADFCVGYPDIRGLRDTRCPDRTLGGRPGAVLSAPGRHAAADHRWTTAWRGLQALRSMGPWRPGSRMAPLQG
jgi:hypothetical protein